MEPLKYSVMFDQETIATFKDKKDAESFFFAKFEHKADCIFQGKHNAYTAHEVKEILDRLCGRFNIVTAE